MPENLKPRQSAVRILARVLADGQTTDAAISAEKDYRSYADADRHFIKLLILTTLRRLGQIDAVLAGALKRPLPKKQQTVLLILRLALAQYLFLKTPAYATVNTAVALTRRFHFDGLSGLVNAVLRHIMRQKNLPTAGKEPICNIPDWLYHSWVQVYGAAAAEQIAGAVLEPPALDISVAENPVAWAERWHGQVLFTGSVRVQATDPLTLDGFAGGACWVQNAAASVPAQLFSNLRGKSVADLCAAPGGKTAQLAFMGARVAAFDISDKRLNRLRDNLKRLGLTDKVSVQAADALSLSDKDCFDAVLLDAPCSATGTIARHPELKYQTTPADVERLSALQQRLLRQAVRLVRPGGEVVFATCSLQPEEGDAVVRAVADIADVVQPTDARWAPYVTAFGSLRFLPLDGLDGFYACLLRKK